MTISNSTSKSIPHGNKGRKYSPKTLDHDVTSCFILKTRKEAITWINIFTIPVSLHKKPLYPYVHCATTTMSVYYPLPVTQKRAIGCIQTQIFSGSSRFWR